MRGLAICMLRALLVHFYPAHHQNTTIPHDT